MSAVTKTPPTSPTKQSLLAKSPSLCYWDTPTRPTSKAKSASSSNQSKFALPNPHLSDLGTDYLYHLGLNSSMPLADMFSDVRFVCMGGSADRAFKLARRLRAELDGVSNELGTDVVPIGKTERFSLYKVGPVISVNHGMGMPSMSILLHEITKLLHYAGINKEDVRFIRIGTSGGVGVEGGTIVVSECALNGTLEEKFELGVLGKMRSWPTKFDETVLQEVLDVAKDFSLAKVVRGKTMAANCFYEGQGRLDGAFCDYTEQDKMDFLKKLYDVGVRNIEMEAAQFAAFCGRLGIKAFILNVALLNRLNGDQVSASPKQLSAYSDNAISLAIKFIKSKM
mmetsp:Transcript_11473/g.17191  ORF Transcript_11473/g.17191 Transcript_11473/m.17191 type:complete len:339 (+) Transcript_11473:50-1066(+)